MSRKVVDVKLNEFSKWFRKRVRDPITKAVGITESQQLFINSTLPQELYQRIVRLENAKTELSGAQKMVGLTTELRGLIEPQGLKSLMPLIRQWAEQAVMYVYKTHFMTKFKEMGLHEWLEAFLNEDLDNDGDVGVKSVKSKKPVSDPADSVEPVTDPLTPS